MFNWVLLTQILLCLYFLQILDFLVASQIAIFLEDGIMHFFSGNLSTGTGLAINFDLVKCTEKININSYTQFIMEMWREDFHQKGKI